jgi:DME family drug/metabolite transporter
MVNQKVDSMTEGNHRVGIGLILVAALLWGTLGIAFRGLQELGATSVAIGFWRALIAAPVIGLILLVRQPAHLKIAARDLPLMMGYGLVSVAMFFVVYAAAVQYASVAVAAVLLYTAPAWVIVLAALLFRETLTPQKGVAVLLTFVGVALVAGLADVGNLNVSGLGLATGLGAGFTYATFSLFGKAALKNYAPTTTIFYGLLFGALFLLPFVWEAWDAFLAPLNSVQGWGWILYMGILPTAGSFWLYMAGLGYLGDAGRASVLATLEPVVAALLGFLLLNEGLSPVQLAGGGLVVVGIVISSLRR